MGDFYQFHDSRFYKVVSSSGEQFGTCPILEQAIGAGKGYAASLGEPVLVIEILKGHTNRSVRCFPDGHTERLATPFMKAEKRLVSEFAAEIEALGLGLKANTHSLGGMYAADGVFVLNLQTEVEPVKGNKAKMESLRAAGYAVDVFAPYDWNRRLGFVAHTSRRVEITAADEEVC